MKTIATFLVFGLTAACASDNDDLLSKRNDALSAREGRTVLDVRCATASDCPANFECEVEVEHGVSTSYCKEHRSTEASSSSGGGSSSGGSSSGGSSSGSVASGAACTTDADCASGLECEVEVEHGVTTSTCKPHSGGRKR